MRQVVSGTVLMLLILIGMVMMATEVNPVKGQWMGSVYIMHDGSIYPEGAPVSTSDNITYVLTDDIYGTIVVKRNNIIVDGSGFTVYTEVVGVDISQRYNVTIKNFNIVNGYDPAAGQYPEWQFGIYIYESSHIRIVGNNATKNLFFIWLQNSHHNEIIGNNIYKNYEAIRLNYSSYNVISHNNISFNDCGIILDWHNTNNNITENIISNNDGTGIELYYSQSNLILGNNLVGNSYGVWLHSSKNNKILENNIVDNEFGITFEGDSSSNIIYHNNFIYNSEQVFDFHWTSPWVSPSINKWNNTYPSGGNYWSDYAGDDYYSGPSQDQPGSDGIGDTPYIIDDNNIDYYPLMSPWSPPPPPPIVDNIPPDTWLIIGKPKFVVNEATYLTSDTSLQLTAVDNPGGSGVALTAYRIYNDTHKSDWLVYTRPFYLTGLSDGTYQIDFNSTDYAGNVERTKTAEVILDNTPPSTTITVGEPKLVANTIFVTTETLFSLYADDGSGSGVYSTAYRIYNNTYNGEWKPYSEPFRLTSLSDGVYTIEFNSTDNLGNVESTKSIQVTLFSWNYVFTDTEGRGTTLKINLAYQLFQFISPDKDYGIRKATTIRKLGRAYIVAHYDGQLALSAVFINTNLDFCIATAWDLQTGKHYILLDKMGKE
ncbi:right-handed parallel beta-helix repeat-containing protein [Candidatus Bathyarchaeota archaeon]|nr:right-handed parallel beta-helix repeat-containing protein [Candidatus Bathyarchaeota archaeon]